MITSCTCSYTVYVIVRYIYMWVFMCFNPAEILCKHKLHMFCIYIYIFELLPLQRRKTGFNPLLHDVCKVHIVQLVKGFLQTITTYFFFLPPAGALVNEPKFLIFHLVPHWILGKTHLTVKQNTHVDMFFIKYGGEVII